VIDSVKLDHDRVFRVQINDVDVRLLMLQNNEMDAMWLPEPQATAARLMKHPVVYDTRKQDLQLGVLAFRDKEMRRPERAKQLKLLVKAWNAACDNINKHGVRHYKKLIVEKMKVRPQVADSLPKNLKFQHVMAPREQDIEIAQKAIKN
jgi:NitT/TauT family transport system substrate-binding protein